MKRVDTNRRETLFRVKQFVEDHPIVPANPRVTALATSISAAIVEVDTYIGDQDTGRGVSRGGVGDCRRIAQELRALMRQISDIGKSLDPDAFPGIAEQLRMPSNAYAVIEARAHSFVEVVTPAAMKAEFVERLMPANFDVTLQGLIDDFVQARERKHSGRAEQIGGTAGLSEAVRRGMKLARQLDAILSSAYAKNAALYAAWKSAIRVKREPVVTPATPSTLVGGGGGSGGEVALAASSTVPIK